MNPFDSEHSICTSLLPVFSLMAMWGIHKLLNKLVPIPTKEEILKDNEEDFEFISEKEVNESRENLINFKKTAGKDSNGRFKPSWFLISLWAILVLFAPSVNLFQFGYMLAAKYGSNSTVVSLCNGMDSETFQNFLSLWKENNEAQKKLNQWQNDVAAVAAGDNETSDAIKEYFAQRIQNATEMIKAANATLQPQFQIYKECFITKQNEILIYCFGSWLFLYIFMTIVLSIEIYWVKFLKRVDDCADIDRYIDFYTYLSQKLIKFVNWLSKKPNNSDEPPFKLVINCSIILLIWYGPLYFGGYCLMYEWMLKRSIPEEFLY